MNKLFLFVGVFVFTLPATAQSSNNLWTCSIDQSKGSKITLDLDLEYMWYSTNGMRYDFRQKSKNREQRMFYVFQLTEAVPPAYEAIFERATRKISLYEYHKGGPKKSIHLNIQCHRNKSDSTVK